MCTNSELFQIAIRPFKMVESSDKKYAFDLFFGVKIVQNNYIISCDIISNISTTY